MVPALAVGQNQYLLHHLSAAKMPRILANRQNREGIPSGKVQKIHYSDGDGDVDDVPIWHCKRRLNRNCLPRLTPLKIINVQYLGMIRVHNYIIFNHKS